jgi:hypothetical protein
MKVKKIVILLSLVWAFSGIAMDDLATPTNGFVHNDKDVKLVFL